MSDYEIQACFEHTAPEYDPDTLTCELPAQNEDEAVSFLETIASGGALGTGTRLSTLGVDMPRIRREYEEAVEALVRQVKARQSAGTSAKELAEFIVRERTKIVRSIRMRHGLGQTVLFEIRDNAKYGLGGRTPSNMHRHYYRRGYRGDAVYQQMIRGATKPNAQTTGKIMGAARYLRHGGRVVVVFSVATTAYVLLTTPEEELERVLYEEAGGFLGGSAGAGLGIGLCLVFGVASGGWGLLACGVIGGMAGSAGGSYASNRIYYATNDDVITQAENDGVIGFSLLEEELVCR